MEHFSGGGGGGQKHNVQKPSRFSLRVVTMAKLIRTNKLPSSPPCVIQSFHCFPPKCRLQKEGKKILILILILIIIIIMITIIIIIIIKIG